LTIDVAFDFRSDAGGRDPDTHSLTLRQYHQRMWSRALPNGATFNLSATTRLPYLRHKSVLGEFTLSSDSVIPTYDYWKTPPAYFAQIPGSDLEEFTRVSYTMGGMMIFPSNRIDGKWTINQARGSLVRTIGDRFDLTLECIRRHYQGERDASGLAETLARYREFFALFDDFRGYVDFFLLQDLVTSDYSTVRFFTPFANYSTAAVPQTLDEYTQYRNRSVEFVEARNHRIAAYSRTAD
jgi:hypothetical protein